MNNTDVKHSASIEVITVPSHISLTCPHCEVDLDLLRLIED